MIVVRYQKNEGISLNDMQSYHSLDGWNGTIKRRVSGVCSTEYASFLLHWIANNVAIGYSGYHSKVNVYGEVLVLNVEDTGERCVENQPVVYPLEILLRVPIADFINLEYLRGRSYKMEGKKYYLVERLLDYENVSNLKLSLERASTRKKRFSPRWMDIWSMLQMR